MASSDILDAMNLVHGAHKAISAHLVSVQQLMAQHKDSGAHHVREGQNAMRMSADPGNTPEQKSAYEQQMRDHFEMANHHREAPVKLRTAYNNLEQSKWRFGEALTEMGKHAIPRGVPVILHDAANKLNYANQQLNHESVVRAYGASSPYANSDTHGIVRQIANLPSFRNGKR